MMRTVLVVASGLLAVSACKAPELPIHVCNDPLATRTIQLLSDKGGWTGYGERSLIYRGRLGLWVANSDYGLGIRAGEYAEYVGPDDGALSDTCKGAVWKEFARVFIIPASNDQRAQSLKALSALKH